MRPSESRMPQLPRLGYGAANLGNLFREVTDDQAWAILDAAWESGIRLYDTAPHYGLGLSERRLGAFLRTKPRDEFVLSTKAGRLIRPRSGMVISKSPGIVRKGDEIHMVTPAATQKVRNLERSPRAAIVVTDPADPYQYLELRGAVEVRREPAAIAAELRQIAARYIGERAEAYTAARDPNTRALIVFRPDRIHRYDGTPVS